MPRRLVFLALCAAVAAALASPTLTLAGWLTPGVGGFLHTTGRSGGGGGGGGCLIALDFAQACNSQYLAIGGMF